MAEWRVYGCGSASSSRFSQSSYEFVDGDVRMQIDFGSGAIYQRCRFEKDINRVLDAVGHLYVTHGHHDHTGDLVRHIVAWKYTPDYSPGPPVQLYCSQHTLELIESLLSTSGFEGIVDEIYTPHILAPEQSFSVGHLTVTPFPVEHMKGSMGLRIETPDGVHVTATSDTSYDLSLADTIQGQDLLVTEASFFEMEHFMHLNLEQAATLAAKAKAKALLLVHFYPEIESIDDDVLKEHAAKWFEGEVFFARDGLSLRYDPATQNWNIGTLF